ncbi:MAG TPA: hypothetical protein VFS36_12885 [Chitinophagaceae bacterium]|nr:hypothetical protein [Chitinophagaceae bacterium]
MKLRLLLFSLLASAFLNDLLAVPPAYITLPDGVILFTDPLLTGSPHAVKLEVIADNIIRVIAAPGKEIAPGNSLVTVYHKKPGLTWNVIPSEESLRLKTPKLIATIDRKTGAVTFTDLTGKKILAEKQPFGRSFQSAVFDGKRYYTLTQTFQTTGDDAWYGLGQHQNGIMNYRGQQVTFFQNNTEVAIPFLISSKNYGVLWDNYYWDLLRQGVNVAAAAIAESVTLQNGGANTTKTILASKIIETKGLVQIPYTQITLSNNVLKQNAGW